MENITIENLLAEGPVKSEKALWLKTKINAQPGKLYLTQSRIAYLKDANPFAGILKLFVKSARSSILFNIELDEIQDISKDAFGVNKNVLVITYDKNQHVKFLVDSFESWETEIKKITE